MATGRAKTANSFDESNHYSRPTCINAIAAKAAAAGDGQIADPAHLRGRARRRPGRRASASPPIMPRFSTRSAPSAAKWK